MASNHRDLSRLLKGLAAPAILDAVMQRYEHRAHLANLVSPTPGRVLFGQAATIQYVGLRSDVRDPAKHSFATKFYEAIGTQGGAGKVLVLSSGGNPHTSLGGGTKLSRLDQHGVAGLVADGPLRDFHELKEYGFVAYCRGETALAGDGSVMPFAANVPVSIDGVTVMPGDYVYADSHGAVVIPGAGVQETLEQAHELEKLDQEWVGRIRKEDPARVVVQGSGEK